MQPVIIVALRWIAMALRCVALAVLTDIIATDGGIPVTDARIIAELAMTITTHRLLGEAAAEWVRRPVAAPSMGRVPSVA